MDLLWNKIRNRIADYEATHYYDEYHYSIAPIGHNPYELISAVTALMNGEWEADEVSGILEQIYYMQYTFTEQVTAQTRYRTEMRIDYFLYTDPSTGIQQIFPYEYTVEVPYTYYICNLQLSNIGMEAASNALMNDEQRIMYGVYMETLGNRPEVFGTAY